MIIPSLLALLSVASALPSLWDTGQLPFLGPQASDHADSQKVNVTLYVMSRCPDSRICEAVFQDVLRADGIPDKVDFGIQMVTAGKNESDPTGLSCKHGPLECAGNAHYLCLKEHLPLESFLAVLACENFQTPFPGDIGKVSLTRQCTEASKIDWWESGVGQCIQGHKAREDDGKEAAKAEKLGKEARDLLRENVGVTQERGVKKACYIEIGSTLVPGGQRTCLVDDKAWQGCDDGHTAQDFIRVIEEEHKALQG